MASVRIDVLRLYRKLYDNEFTEKQIKKFQKIIEKRIARWGRQFEGSRFHERTLGEGMGVSLERVYVRSRTLELSNIPEEAVARFYKEVFPEMFDDKIHGLPEYNAELDGDQ